MAGTVIGVASIPIKLDFSGVSKQVSQGGKEAAEGLTRDINGKLRDSKGRFVKSGEDVGDNIKKGVDKKGKDAADGLTSRFKGAFTKIAALAGGVAIGSQLIDIVGMGSSLDAMRKKVATVFEGSTGDIRRWADKSNEALGLTDEQVSTLAANFGDLMKPMGFTSIEAANMSKKVIDLSGALSAWSGGTRNAADVSGILTKAMLGERDELKSLGISISEADVDARLAAKGQQELTGAALQQAEAVATQELIFEKSTDAQKAWADGSMDAIKNQNNLKATVGDLKESIANGLAPVVATLAEWLGKMLPVALDKAGELFGWLGDRLSGVVGWFRNAVEAGGYIVEFFRSGGGDAQAFGEIMTLAFGERTLGVFRTLYTVVRSVFDFITETAIPRAQQVIGSFLAGLSGEGGEGSFFTDLGEAARGLVRVFTEDVLPVIREVISWIGDHLKPILIGLGIAFAVITGPVLVLVGAFIFAYQKFQVFRDIVAVVMTVVKEIVTTYIDIMIIYFGLLLVPIKLAAKVAMEVLWPAIQTAFRFITDAVMWAWENVLKPIFGFISAIITNVLIPTFNFLKNVVVDIVFPLIVAVIKDAWGIVKPVFDALVGFFNSVLMPAFDHLWGVVSNAFQGIRDVISTAWGFIQPVLQAVIDFIWNKLGPVWEGMKMMAKVAFDALPGLIGAALRLVGGIVAGFLDGVGSIADAIGLDAIAKVLKSGAGSARGWGQGAPAVRDQGAGQQLRNKGGPIYGPNVDRDIVPAMLTPGEFVIRKSAVQKYGPGFMEKINAGRYAAGGLIPDIDIPGLADGVVDKVRSVGTAALDRVWPRLDVGGGAFSRGGLPAGGANYLRDAVLSLIRSKEQEMGTMSGGGFTRAGGGGPAGRYTAGMERARAAILNLYGPMSVGGYANRNIAGTNQRSAHGMWRAWDFMTGKNVSKGNAVSKYLIDNASQYGLKGLIWNAQKNFGSGWAPYRHPGGGTNDTLMHRDHVHAEFFNKGGQVPYGKYDQGGYLPTGLSIAENRTGAPERVGGPLVGVVNLHNREDVDEFWRRAEFAAMAGRL